MPAPQHIFWPSTPLSQHVAPGPHVPFPQQMPPGPAQLLPPQQVEPGEHIVLLQQDEPGVPHISDSSQQIDPVMHLSLPHSSVRWSSGMGQHPAMPVSGGQQR